MSVATFCRRNVSKSRETRIVTRFVSNFPSLLEWLTKFYLHVSSLPQKRVLPPRGLSCTLIQQYRTTGNRRARVVVKGDPSGEQDPVLDIRSGEWETKKGEGVVCSSARPGLIRKVNIDWRSGHESPDVHYIII